MEEHRAFKWDPDHLMTPLCTLLVVPLEPHWFAPAGNLALTDVAAGKENMRDAYSAFLIRKVWKEQISSHMPAWKACSGFCKMLTKKPSEQNPAQDKINRGKSYPSKGKWMEKGMYTWAPFTSKGSGNVAHSCARGFSPLLKQRKEFQHSLTLIENVLVAERNISSWSWEISSATNIIVVKAETLK